MQHYIHYGLGFEGSLLSEEEADVLLSTNSDNVRLISFTEDYESRDWASVVVKDCGEITNSGKFSTWNNLKKMCSQEVIIDVPTKEYILKNLTQHNLQHLIDKVEVILFSVYY